MATSVVPPAWQDFFRRHERTVAATWLALSLLVMAVVIVRPTRVALLTRSQQVADLWDARWERRLQAGEDLVTAGKFEEASVYLTRLDAEYPAPHARYGRDKEREHLLRLLAQSYEGQGKTARTMDAWTRLTQFDSLNHANHMGYAQAAERLLSGWALAPEARDGFEKVLTLLPSHLPALRGFIDYYMDRGEFPPVVAAYRTYIDSFLLDGVTITVGDSAIVVPVQVDGRPHDVEATLPVPAGWRGNLVLAGAFPMAVERIAIVEAARVGSASPRTLRELDLSGLSAEGMTRSGDAWIPTQASASLRVPMDGSAPAGSRVLLRVRVFKLIDASLLAQVVKSHRNTLDATGLAETQARSAAFKSAAAADSAFGRIGWLSGGQYVRGAR